MVKESYQVLPQGVSNISLSLVHIVAICAADVFMTHCVHVHYGT